MSLNKRRLRAFRNWFEKNVSQLDINLDMETYALDREGLGVTPQQTTQCATSCCLLGFSTIWPTGRKQVREHTDWENLSVDLFGLSPNGRIWDLLFADFHPNSKKQALKRMDLALETPTYMLETLLGDYTCIKDVVADLVALQKETIKSYKKSQNG